VSSAYLRVRLRAGREAKGGTSGDGGNLELPSSITAGRGAWATRRREVGRGEGARRDWGKSEPG
jgi:hypothetical protein